ncbi:hypothetical protein M405DRAFT_936853 [Rhizopogon salebrosus TDB-379]|nr:hypothetical protein M405DRAFT_936853 [Rhizopogon salebrosus TDB-379]
MRHGRHWTDDSMHVDGEDKNADESSEESEEDEEDLEGVKTIEVGCFVRTSEIPAISSCPMSACTRSDIQTVLAPILFPETCLDAISEHHAWIHDACMANVILSSLSVVASIIKVLRWTIVIPAPVIMELDSLSSSPSKLGEAAQEAVAYISRPLTHHVAHRPDLKRQLPDVAQYDLFLKSMIWQDEHWVDRSALLKNASPMPDDASAVTVP